MIFAVNLVQYRGDFEVVVRFNVLNPSEGPNFRCEQIIDSCARGPVYEVVRGMLVGPCGPAATFFDNLENCIHANESMWKDRRALFGRIKGQFSCVDSASGINHVAILVDRRIVNYSRSDLGAIRAWR